MGLRLITPAASYPVTLAEAKEAARVDGTDEDNYISNTLIPAATSFVEYYTGQALVEQTWEQVEDDLPSTGSLKIEKLPLISVDFIKYFDTDEVEQTLPTTDYTVDNVGNHQGWIQKPTDVTWPEVADGINNVTVRFKAGYATLPAEIKAALLFLIASWFDNRSTAEIPDAFHALLTNHRSFAF